jgi:hypothetical protein
MDMQDKEFDDLFRSKLDEFELEPSATVWPGIDGELRSVGRKRSLMRWLSIAASIIVLAAVGVLFIPKQTIKQVKASGQGTIVKVTHPVSTLPSPAKPVRPVQSPLIKKINDIQAVAIVKKTNKKVVEPEKSGTQLATTPAPLNNTAPEVIAVVAPKQTNNNAIVPDKNTALTPNISVEPTQDFNVKPLMAANEALDINKKDTIPVKTRRKIHGFAGLVSLVIAKVDKRKDKTVESRDDDDESNIVGVNLGIVKIKKGE